MPLADRIAARTPFYYGWIVLFSAGSSQFVRNAVSSLTLAVFIYPLSQELGWSRTLIAGAASVGGLLSSGASPGVGWLVDRFGARVVLAISVFVLGLATISLAWATAPIAFYVAYGVGRVIFSSPVQIGASVVVSRWFIRMRGRAAGLLSMCHSLGMILFPLLASLIIAYRDFQTAWIVLGVLVWVIALLPVTLLIAETPESMDMKPDGDDAPDDRGTPGGGLPEARDPVWALADAVRTPTLWVLAVGGGIMFVIQSGTNIHLVAYLRDQGLGQAVAASAISVTAVMTAVGSVSWGWIVERLPMRSALPSVAGIMALGSALFVTVDSNLEAYLYASLFGFALGGLLVVPPVAYADYFGRRSLGTIRGVAEPFNSLGQAIGAVFSGAIFDATDSYHAALWSFAAIGVIASVALSFARPPKPFGPSAPRL
jgi:MFS family permease